MNDDILKIGVVAVGGAGIGMVSKLRAELPHLARFVAIEINKESLNRSTADLNILIGDGTNRPRRTDLARFMAQPVKTQIVEAVAGLDVVFIVAGMGGVAGSALSLTVADLLLEMPGVLLTIGVPITPFAFEGPRRQKTASIALKSLANRIDCLIPLRNEALAESCSADGVLTSVLEQSLVVLKDIYSGIAITICEEGFIGVDFDHIKTVFKGHRMILGVATGYGADAVYDAIDGALKQISDGDIPLDKASAIWIVVEGACSVLKMRDVNEVVNRILCFTRSEVSIAFSGFWRKDSSDYCKITIYSGS